MKQLIWMNFKYQFKNYKLVFIQFVIGFLALLCGFSFLFGIKQQSNRIYRLADKNTYHIINSSSVNQNDTKDGIQALANLYAKLNEIDGISQIQIFQVDHLSYGEGQQLDIESLNDNMIDNISFLLKKGSLDSLKQYSKDSKNGFFNEEKVIPALVSEKYQEQYPLGSQFQSTLQDVEKQKHTYTFEIVGILGENMPMWRGNSTDTISNLEMNRPKLIVPLFRQISSSLPYTFNILYKANADSDVNRINSDIIELYQDCGIDIKIQKIFDEAASYFDGLKVLWLYAFGLAFILLFLTELGNIGITLSLFHKRKKEFGTYIAMGMNLHDLKIINFVGMLMQILAAFVISICVYVLIFQCLIKGYPYPLDFNTLISAFSVTFILNFLVQCIPMHQIGKIEPIKLLDSGE